MMRTMQNPQQMLMNIMGNSQMMQDPRARKTAQMLQNHDTNGLKEMAENMCREYGTTTDQMINQLKSMF